MRLTLSSLNEIQPGQAGYTVPPNPPFLGTQDVASKFEDQCTEIKLDPGTMNQVGQVIQCPAVFNFLYNNARGTQYGLGMTGPSAHAPESTYVQIQCNSLGANGYCNDWFVDPIPAVNADGNTSPGQAIARLNYVDKTGTFTNLGDFYMTFHVHLTRP